MKLQQSAVLSVLLLQAGFHPRLWINDSFAGGGGSIDFAWISYKALLFRTLPQSPKAQSSLYNLD